MLTLLAFIAALGVLIVVHEYGHYWVARRCGVKVLRFSVGFGKALWARKLGPDQTEWVIAAFPLGGYVKMLDEREEGVPAEEVHRAFNRQSVWKRMAIVVAGPLANFLLAVLLYWALFMAGVPGVKPILGEPPAGSPAAQARLQAGDTVRRVGTDGIESWQDVRWALLQHATQRGMVEIEVLDGSRSLVRQLDLSSLTADDLDKDFLRKLGLQLYLPKIEGRLGKVVPGSVADKAGLKPEDRVLEVNGRRIARWEELVEVIRSSPGKAVELVVDRQGGQQIFQVVPESVDDHGHTVGKVGISPKVDRDAMQQMAIEVRHGPLRALGEAMTKTWSTTVFTLKMLGKMVLGEVSWRNISGPITIADYAGQSASMGWMPYLGFLALISISLGVLNLLPVPLLDGGHLMYYTVELVKGSPLSDRAMDIGQRIGIGFMALLMFFALYNDLTRIISG